MREALYGAMAGYKELVGESNILLLFLASALALIFINYNKTQKDNSDNERRRLNPTVFLLSLWSGVAYTIVELISTCAEKIKESEVPKESETKTELEIIKKPVIKRALIAVFVIAAIILSGEYVFSGEIYDDSFYHMTGMIPVISILVVILYFGIYYLVAKELYEESKLRTKFMAIIIFLHLFGLYSQKAAAISLLLSPITIPSIIIHGVMPVFLLIYLKHEDTIKKKYFEEDNKAGQIKNTDNTQKQEDLENNTDLEESEEYLEEWDMNKHKILNMRNMAIAFGALVIALICIVFVLNTKINTLYNATVVLEKAAKSKITECELKDDSGNVYLTLMISPDGNATAIGGGSESNGSACYDFISQYTNKISKWYLYEDSESGRGAYDYCVKQGLIVDDAYVISGITKID